MLSCSVLALTAPLLSFAALSSAASASTSVTKLFLFDVETQAIEASVIKSDATAVTYLMACPPGTDSNDCDFPGAGYTVTAGPSIFAAAATVKGAVASLSCKIEPTTAAMCTQNNVGAASNDPNGVGSTSILSTSVLPHYIPVTITAGLEKLGAAITSATTGSETSGKASSTGSSAAAAATSAAASSSSASASASAKSTAGAAMATGAPQLLGLGLAGALGVIAAVI